MLANDKGLRDYFDELLCDLSPGSSENALEETTQETTEETTEETRPGPQSRERDDSPEPAPDVAVSVPPQPTAQRSQSKAPPKGFSLKDKRQNKQLADKQKEQLQALLSKPIVGIASALETKAIDAAADRKKLTTEALAKQINKAPIADISAKQAAPELHEQQLGISRAEAQLADQAYKAASTWCENGRPEWAQEHFEALLFEVSGLKLAVPLVALGQILPMEQGLTHIFGQSSWFMGVLASPFGNLRVVNTALFVMPERYDESFLDSAAYVISVHGVPWALAVDSVTQPIKLDPNEINWRSERSKRPWLAGTVKSAMCALIDIPTMAELLIESDAGLNNAK
ncbi:chemotaxis protein CheW [Agaribacterium haliotis]|uniref:chemotaxis protein CheW n=1 Tax=Agaribacterium haliotis TaxID=2013869 RepID=UPI000BB52E4D|nr:chemotaxis protein CheW [Agaribacterium haliotis]